MPEIYSLNSKKKYGKGVYKPYKRYTDRQRCLADANKLLDENESIQINKKEAG